MTYVFILGASAAPTAQLALNNKAHELQMCKKKMEWQNEKIEELTKERFPQGTTSIRQVSQHNV